MRIAQRVKKVIEETKRQEAEKAKQILATSVLAITLKERKELEKQTHETEEKEDFFGEGTVTIPTIEAEKAQLYLKKSSLKIDLEDIFRLIDESHETKEVELFGYKEYVATDKADKAKRVLAHAIKGTSDFSRNEHAKNIDRAKDYMDNEIV